MKLYCSILLLVGAVGAVTPCFAAPRHRVEPKIRVWLSSPMLRSLAGPGEVQRDSSGRILAPISVRFRSIPPESVLAALERRSVRFLRDPRGEGRVHLGRFYSAQATTVGLRALSRCPEVERVELDTLIQPSPPLDTTPAEIGAHALWPKEIQGKTLTGHGVLIGNIDSGIDVYHPAFFRADGGTFAWLDSNKNGAFDPGIDAVDLNKNGVKDSGETLGLIDAVLWSRYTRRPLSNSQNGTFEPRRDWLYADKNGNGKRDQGDSAGFADTTPTFGEQLFVGEDLNKNGKLDLSEKVVALKTSKIVATSYNGKVRRRGTDLSTMVNDSGSSHGMGTTGAMIGGQRGRHDWVGITPDAEMIMARTPTNRSIPLSSLITWLAQAKVQVMLHEYAPWVGHHLDGSSNHEQLMDQAAQLGIPQACPAGNLGGSDKHMRISVKPGATVKVPLTVPSGDPRGPHYYMGLSLLWRNYSVNMDFSLKDSSGRTVKLDTNNTAGRGWGDGKTVFYSYSSTSSRKTSMMLAYLMAGSSGAPKELPTGAWDLIIKNPSTGATVTVLGYAVDGVSSWGKGIAFTKNQSEDGLVCFPATADSAITIGAYAGHVGLPWEYQHSGQSVGDLRRYSGRGVRIDGQQIMDICAPDNPVTTFNRITNFSGLGAFQVFGGTSGAGPHVAAAAALIKQHSPTLDGLAVRAAIRKGAQVDVQTGKVPSNTWGAGKLRVYRSIFGKDPVTNKRPTVSLAQPGVVWLGKPATFTPVATDNEDKPATMKVRWDIGYDGVWDGPATAIGAKVHTFTEVGPAWVKVQVQDSGGLTAEAAVRFVVYKPGAGPDQGIGHDGGVSADGKAGDAETTGGDASVPTDEDSGCGCAAGRGPAAGDAALFAMLVLLGGLVRRGPRKIK